MYTSVMLLALANPFVPPGSVEPPWLTDYTFARSQVQEGQRPLAVVVGTGKSGWQHLVKDGQLTDDVGRLLAENYVCLYIDSESDYGKRLATAFHISEG